MKRTSFLLITIISFVIFVSLLNSSHISTINNTLAPPPTSTSFAKTTSASVTITTTILEAPYSTQYYYMDIKLTGISLLKGDPIDMIFPTNQCYFGIYDLSVRCYNSNEATASIPSKEYDDLIEPLTKAETINYSNGLSCSYPFTVSTMYVPDGGTIRCIVYNVYSLSTANSQTTMNSIRIGDKTFTGSEIVSDTFYAAKPIADFFQVSFGAQMMKIPYPVTNFNHQTVSASLRMDQLVIKYLDHLPPNIKASIRMKAQFNTTTRETCEIDFDTFSTTILPSAENQFATSDIFFSTSDVPLINQPAKDIGVFFDGNILYLFTGPNPDQDPGSISIPISMQVAFLATQVRLGNHASCLHSFIAGQKELESATLFVEMNFHEGFNELSVSLDYPIELLKQIPIELTDGTQLLYYSIADDQMVLELQNGIVYNQEVYDFELLTGETNGNTSIINSFDFFSKFDEMDGTFLQRTDPLVQLPIDSNSFVNHKLTTIHPVFSQANLRLNFPRLLDQDGISTPLTPSIVTYNLYQIKYTVGHVPFPTFIPLDMKSNVEILVSNTKATMFVQFALSAQISDVFARTENFNVDAIFTLRPHRLMGEIFPQARPIPVCTFVDGPSTLRIMPHIYSPTGADIHTTAGIRIAGTLEWDLKITMKCEQDIIPGLKTGKVDLLALPWVLRLYPHRIYYQKIYIDTDVNAIYDDNWKTHQIVANNPLLYVLGPAIQTQIQFNFVIDKVVQFIKNYTPREDPENRMFGNFTSSDLHWTASNDPGLSATRFRYYNLASNYDAQFAYPGNTTHLASIQKQSFLPLTPNINPDPSFSWPSSSVSTLYPELSQQLKLTIQIIPHIGGLVRYPNSINNNNPSPIPYDRMYTLTNFPWLTYSDGPCFSTLQCDRRNMRSPSDPFWTTTDSLCFEGSCQLIRALHINKISQLKAHIFNPQKRRPDEFKMVGKINIATVDDVIIRGANEFGFGYIVPKFTIQFTSIVTISLSTMINEQHVIIDNNNSEYNSIVGQSYTIQLLSFPSTSTGDIISPTLFRVHWTSSPNTIPVAETLSQLNIPARDISAIGASKMKFRVIYPNLLITPTAINPNPITHLDSIFFTSMSDCMNPPAVVLNYSDSSQWTNRCQNGGQCQSVGCKCVNGYTDSLCATSPPDSTGCMFAPTTFCGTHGTCNQTTLRCDCSTGWLGFNCATKEACTALGRDVCSNNGHFLTNPATEQCDDGKCECDNLWFGSKCSICSLSCKNGGRAHKLCTTCGCPAGYAGVQCNCSQQLASFTIAMNNELVAYVHSVRSAFATAQSIVDSATIDISSLDIPQETSSEYSIISDAIAQDLMDSLGFSATTTALLTMDTIVRNIPPNDDIDEDSFISTRFSFRLTYNCDQNEETLNLREVWASNYVSLLPTKTINTYFTPTRINPLPEDIDIVTPPGTMNDDNDDTDDEQENASFSHLISIIFFLGAIISSMV